MNPLFFIIDKAADKFTDLLIKLSDEHKLFEKLVEWIIKHPNWFSFFIYSLIAVIIGTTVLQINSIQVGIIDLIIYTLAFFFGSYIANRSKHSKHKKN